VTSPLRFARRILPVLLIAAGLPAAAQAQDAPFSRLGAYLAGRIAAAERDMQAASRYYAFALEADPANAELRRHAFQAHLAAGDMNQALRLAESLVRDANTANIAHLTLAAAAAKKGDFAAARRHVEVLPETGANRLLKPGFLAWIEFGLGDPVKPVEALRALSGIEALRVFLELHLALVHDAAGRTALADAAYKSAAGGVDTPPLRVTQAYASFLARGGRRQDAIALWDKYLAASPDSSIADIARQRLVEGKAPRRLVAKAPEGMAELLLNLAGALQQENATLPALIYARLADYLRPNDPDTLNLIAGLLESDDQFEAAVELYRRIPRDSDLSWSARRAAAANLAQLKKTDEAAKLFEEMAGERRERWDALLLLGNLYRSEKQFAKAVEAYDRALVRIPKLEERHWNLLYVRGIANERAKNWPRAEADFKKALELKPNEPYVLNYLAYTWVDRGENLDEAKRMLDEAVRQKPDDGAIVDSVGWAYYRLGQFEKALEFLEKAIELAPEDPAINDHLGDVYWRVGRRPEARFQWNRALSLNPEPEDVPKLKEKVDKGLPALPAAPGAKP
jgi:tetratricopeptide (TPR) repeat protein